MTSTIVPILRAVRPVRLTAIFKLPITVSRRFNSADAQKLVANDTVRDAQSKDVAPLPPPQHVVEADIVSGAPSQLHHRIVRIYQPTRNTMQSGGAKGEKWRIDFDTLPGGGRWENPLMGWASSADYMQGTRLSFNSQDDAVLFAEKQGWDYYVQPPTVKRIPPKNYGENYAYKPHTLRIARTK